MATGYSRQMAGDEIAAGHSLVEATSKEEEDKREGKAEGQAEGGDCSQDQVSADKYHISTDGWVGSNCSTLVPRPPPLARSRGGKNFRRKFQSAPLPETSTEMATHQDLCAPRTDLVISRQAPGRAAFRLRERILGAQVQHKSDILLHFEPIEDVSEESGESQAELSDTDGEEG